MDTKMTQKRLKYKFVMKVCFNVYFNNKNTKRVSQFFQFPEAIQSRSQNKAGIKPDFKNEEK